MIISEYKCGKCDLQLPTGFGGFYYVADREGRRISMPEGGDPDIIERATGLDERQAREAGRVGFASHCICYHCLQQFDLDLDRDQKRCPSCGSRNVKSARDAAGTVCPQCGEGPIEANEIMTT